MTTKRNLTEQQERDIAREQGLGPLMDALDAAGRDYDVEVIDGTAFVTGLEEHGVASMQATAGLYGYRWHTFAQWAGSEDPLTQKPYPVPLAAALALLPW